MGDTNFDILGDRWTVVFWEDVEGRSPVAEWLGQLARTRPADSRKVRRHIDLLQRYGVHLSEPYSRQLEGRLRELRPGDWRVTYFADPARRLVLLTTFRKASKKTKLADIRLAEARMRDWIERMT